MNKFHRIFRRTLLVLLAPSLFILTAELICRVFDLGYPTRFLIAAENNGRDVWIDNQLFGYRFFAPAVSRSPTPIVLQKEKGANELRVVILGESAAMGEPEPAFGPARMLEIMLRQQFPDREVTVINAAMTAINSHVILEITRDLKRIQPDYVVCYIGNNEVVGPYGPGTVFGRFSSSRAISRLRSMATRLRLASVIREYWFRFQGTDESHWRGMEMFTEFRVPQNDPRLQNVYKAYARNLVAIIKTIKAAGAVPILSTVAVNLSDQAPLDGSSEKPTETPDVDTALSLLKAERDADSMRFRADSAINQIIRNIGQHVPGVIPVDAESDFEEGKAPGNNFFLDHVHFNISGSFKLAALLDKSIANSLSTSNAMPDFQEVMTRAGWNPISALEIAETMYDRISRPPFSATSDHKKRMQSWSKEVAGLHYQIRSTSIPRIIAKLTDQISEAPNDPHYPYLALRVHLFENEFVAAGEQINHLYQLLPHRADIRGWLAVISAINGQSDQAWKIITQDAPPLGEIPADILISSSETLFQSGYRDEAVTLLHQATDHFPGRTRLKGQWATRLAQSGKIPEALTIFKQLHEKYPNAEWLNEEYGLLLAVTQNFTESESLLSHLQNTSDPDARVKYIQFLLYRHDVSSAINELNAQIKVFPEHAATRRLLAQIYMQQGNYPDALVQLSKAIAIEPWHGEDYARQGTLFDAVNQPAKAVQSYQTALQFLVNPTEVMRSLAWMFATEDLPDIRNPQRALRIIDRLIKTFPEHNKDPYTLHVLAAALASVGQYDQAIAEVDRALQLKSGINDALASELKRSQTLYERNQPIRINRDQGRNP